MVNLEETVVLPQLQQPSDLICVKQGCPRNKNNFFKFLY